jgi:hypothetical protein
LLCDFEIRLRKADQGRLLWRVRFIEALAVDPHAAFANVNCVSGETDDAFYEVWLIGSKRRLEDNDLLPLGIAPEGNVNVSERNAGVVTEAAHDEMVANEQSVFHGTRRNNASLTDRSVDEQKYEANPEPRDDFASDFLLGGQFFFGLLCALILHDSPKPNPRTSRATGGNF